MIYKYILMGAIVASSVYCSFSIKAAGRQKLKLYDALIDFITYIKNGISYYCTPTKVLLEEYESDLLCELGLLEKIRQGEFKSILSDCPMIDAKAQNVLNAFFSNLGKSSSEEQVRNCEWAIDNLNSILEDMRTEITGKYKAYSSLAVISGLMIVLLLI